MVIGGQQLLEGIVGKLAGQLLRHVQQETPGLSGDVDQMGHEVKVDLGAGDVLRHAAAGNHGPDEHALAHASRRVDVQDPALRIGQQIVQQAARLAALDVGDGLAVFLGPQGACGQPHAPDQQRLLKVRSQQLVGALLQRAQHGEALRQVELIIGRAN